MLKLALGAFATLASACGGLVPKAPGTMSASRSKPDRAASHTCSSDERGPPLARLTFPTLANLTSDVARGARGRASR